MNATQTLSSNMFYPMVNFPADNEHLTGYEAVLVSDTPV